MNIDYQELINRIDKQMSYYREEDYVYLLHSDSPNYGNILFQEKCDENIFVVWCNEYKGKPMIEVFRIIKDIVHFDLLFPYIESQEEYDAITTLGGETIDFKDDDAENAAGVSKEFGSLIIRYK